MKRYDIKKRILASATAALITLSIVGTAVYVDSNKAHAAKVTLRGIQELANTHSESSDDGLNPLIILEVVDDYNDARLGYLVGGEEPIDILNNSDGGYAHGIKDMPSANERNAKLTAANPEYLRDSAYTWDGGYNETDGSISVEIRGNFTEVEANKGNYNESTPDSGYVSYATATYKDGDTDVNYDTDGDGEIDTDEIAAINTHNATIYRYYHEYNVSDITQLKPLDDDSEMPIKDSVINTSDPEANAYNWQYFKIDGTAASFEELTEGKVIFSGTEGSQLRYVGTIAENTLSDDGKVRTITDTNANSLTITYNDDDTVSYTLSGTDFLGESDYSSFHIEDGYFHTVKETSRGESAVNIYRIDSATGGSSKRYTPVNGTSGEYSIDNCPSDKGPYWLGGGSRSDYDYVGSNNGNYRFTADYTKKVYEKFSYNNGFKNKEWFKQYVMDRNEDDEYTKLSIDVVTVRADQLTADMVAKAGLVYLNYRYTVDTDGNIVDTAATHDITNADAVIAIIDAVSKENLSVMLESAAYYDAVAGNKDNLKALTLALMKSTVSSVSNLSEVTEGGLWYGDKDPKNDDISYVNRTVFVNDNYKCGSIVGDDFNTIYSDGKTDYGFKAIKEENDAEARYIELQSQDASGFNRSITKATSIRYILNKNTNRSVVKSVLRILDIEPYDTSQYNDGENGRANSLGQETEDNPLYRLYSGNLSDYGNNVKRYERRDIMTKDWVVDNLGFTGDKSNISIDMIGTKEFVGINDDLNSEFDLIYIGMDKALLNTDVSGNTKTDGETKYNRSELNGYVYTHVGDQFSGFNNVRFGIPHNATVVASGNDITPNKVRELKDYIRAGYAVILSDGFYDENGKLNTATVDKSSRMYELMNWLFNGDGRGYLNKNVMRKSELESTYGGADSNREIFSTFLNISKLGITAVSVPTRYDGTTSESRRETMMKAESDGEFYLRYEVQLSNNSAIDTGEATTYDCHLYIDMDADGNYEEIEKLDGIIIDGADESDGHFHLVSGRTYNISRIVPEGYVGFLPWKLEFVQNGRADSSYSADTIRSSITGFSAIPLTADVKPVINVLQIVSKDQDPANVTPDKGNTNNLDLNDADMNNLYDQINEFDVQIYQTNADKFIRKVNLENLNGSGYFNGTYYDFLAQFDIVVLGFNDVFEFSSPAVDAAGTTYPIDGVPRSREDIYKDAALGIREYAMSGRSMLFTHDLTHSNQEYRIHYPGDNLTNNYNGGFYLTYYLRDIMGMDRYGRTAGVDYTYAFDSKNVIKKYEVKTDKSTYGDNKDAGDDYGFTDAIIETRLRGDNGGGYNTGEPNVKYSLLASRSSNLYEHASNMNETIKSINRGQITQYPFDIPETANVAPTHSQYYQLNLDTDNTDNLYDDDVVVWYVLSNDDATVNQDRDHRFYRALYNDARNNYYIYTKGNITYTGAGHSMIGSDMTAERMLFVNTLVASYAAGSHSPKVLYKENPWDSSATITSTYVPYDPELVLTESADTSGTNDGGFLDTQLTVNFKTMNSNIRSASKGLYIKYYVQDDAGTLTISGKKYREVEPNGVELVLNGVKTAADPHFVSNFRIYQAKFDLSKLSLTGTGNVLSRDNAKIYIRIGMDPLEDITDGSLPATESMNELNVFATKLFDLE